MNGPIWQDNHALGRRSLAAAAALTLVLFGLFALASLYLLAGGHLGAISSWCILALTLSASLALARRLGGDWIAPALVASVIVATLIASHVLLDTTYDGQEYHYDATRALADGWNPLREPYQLPADLRGYAATLLWPQHYPQAAWLAAAVPITAGLDVESAKIAPLLAVAVFLAAFGAAATSRLGRMTSLVVALLALANPIIIVQLFTRLNDGLIAACFALTAIFTALWLRDREPGYVLPAAGAMAFALNLKFSAIPVFVLLCATIVVITWIALGRTRAMRAALVLLATGVASIAVLGAHPYVTNAIRHQHPFYPVMGAGAVDIITSNRPAGFSELSAPERLARSYFAPTSSSYDGGHGYKPPFTFQRIELRASGDPDTRLAGFGPLFSGALLLALGLGAWMIMRERTRFVSIALGACAALAIASLALPEAWWARYVPHLWWTVCAVAAVALLSARIPTRRAGWVLAGILLANAALVSASSALQVGERTLDARRQLDDIAAIQQPVCVYLGASHSRLELLRAADVDVRLHAAPLPQSCQPELFASAYRVADPRPNFCTCP